MPTPAHKQRSDYVAGVCLTGLLIAALTLIFVIMGAKSAQPQGPEYTISVPIETGVAGIDTSSSLIYGGLVVGQVTEVKFKDNTMLVQVRLNRRLDLHSSIRIIKESSLLGGTTNLRILDPGSKSAQNQRLTSGQVIPLSKSASGLAGILGKDGSENIDSLTENFEESAKGLQGIVASIRSNDDISSIQDNYEALAEDIQRDVPEWESRYNLILTRVDNIESKGDFWYEQVDQITTSLDRSDKIFSEVTLHFRDEQLKKLEKAINELVVATRESAAKFETSVLPKVDELIGKAETSWNDFQRMYADVKNVSAEVKSTIDYALAQTTLASQQLTLTISEVIGSLGIPLLERPSKEEVNLMAQYAALSEWARSAVQMQEILNTLNSIPELTKLGNLEEQASMARLIDLLRASLADYEAAQNKFDRVTSGQNTGSARRDGVDHQDH